MELFDPRRLLTWRDAIARVRSSYRAFSGRSPRLLRPQLFTEKMQWRKLFDLDPRFAVLCDKVAARRFIADTVGADYLPQLLLVADDPDIPITDLPPSPSPRPPCRDTARRRKTCRRSAQLARDRASRRRE